MRKLLYSPFVPLVIALFILGWRVGEKLFDRTMQHAWRIAAR